MSRNDVSSLNELITSLNASIERLSNQLVERDTQLSEASARIHELEIALEEQAVGQRIGDPHSMEGENEERATGENLRKLWTSEAASAVTSVYRGGRPKKSGRQQIADAANTIRNTATVLDNPKAQTAGLGDCLLGKGLKAGEQGGRPYHHMTGYLDNEGNRKQFRALAYHVTWCDENDQPPPPEAGLFYSHLCHNARCVNPKHGVWEDIVSNKSRGKCTGASADCQHVPWCIPLV